MSDSIGKLGGVLRVGFPGGGGVGQNDSLRGRKKGILGARRGRKDGVGISRPLWSPRAHRLPHKTESRSLQVVARNIVFSFSFFDIFEAVFTKTLWFHLVVFDFLDISALSVIGEGKGGEGSWNCVRPGNVKKSKTKCFGES